MGGLEELAKMEYLGRVIIIGRSADAKGDIVLYAITGRGPSSQARRFAVDEEEKEIYVEPTDRKILETGNPKLLVYPCIKRIKRGVVVSNGVQTELLYETAENWSHLHSAPSTPMELLTKTFETGSHEIEGTDVTYYEPDDPNFTPRISGCAMRGTAALNVIKRSAEDEGALRNYFSFSSIPGNGKMIATYTGVNENPLPSFQGEPLDVVLPWKRIDDAVDAMYEALGPKEGRPDFRVAVAGIYVGATYELGKTMVVKNRHDLRGE